MRHEWEVRDADGNLVEGFDRLWPALAKRDEIGETCAVFGRLPPSFGAARFEVNIPTDARN